MNEIISTPSYDQSLPQYIYSKILYFCYLDTATNNNWKRSLCLVCKSFFKRVSSVLVTDISTKTLANPDFRQHYNNHLSPLKTFTSLLCGINRLTDLLNIDPQLIADLFAQQTITKLILRRLGNVNNNNNNNNNSVSDQERESTLATLFSGLTNGPLEKIYLDLPNNDVPDYLSVMRGFTFQYLSILSIIFSQDIHGHDTILSLLESVAPTMRKIQFISRDDESATITLEPSHRLMTTNFFEQLFGHLSKSRLRSLHIRSLYVGDLQPFLRGLSLMKHLTTLKIPLPSNFYQLPEIREFHAGLLEFIKSSNISIMSIPFSIESTMLKALSDNPNITTLRVMLGGSAKLSDRLQRLTLREDITPSVFSSLMSMNPATNIVRLILLNHRRYITKDNFDQFLSFVKSNKNLTRLYLCDYLYLSDKQKETIIPLLIRDTRIQTLMISLSDDMMPTNYIQEKYRRTKKEFEYLQFLLNQLVLYPQSTVDGLYLDVTNSKALQKHMVAKQVDTGDFKVSQSLGWILHFIRIK
ncbi:hypothetical protein SAMD00019534_045070 [Acytostelium subglobosum LB1]|uniref:hypothetical protein n=1 Tax=Acytostelium subglobosum LB1 TaxID=1410327 RepID=UPI0006451C1C|nr:hypothetical protein SAMD00019534_045070 [Acytostelium subglobosum LB1]GAM21332.1 hypothetical protein SAMD00019534_045070 [Acytostelium subglobosum LB1]|eukprot:XP_012755451.1 hypothetical protein SAMD00019534_045070 [Acytostelium subglobosum LB1]